MTYRLMDLVADQERRCQQGDLMLLEAYLAAYPGLEEDTDTVIELLLREYRLRRESGESPTLAEYIRRFPQYDEILRRQFALVEALEAACAVRQALHESRHDEDTPIAAVQADAPTPLRGLQPTSTLAGNGSWPRIPGYEILGELGRGGVGIVYKARQLALGRLVAVKILNTAGPPDADQRRRFRQEAETAALLKHPNIVPIHEIGEHEELCYLSLEFVEGGSLAEYIATTPQAPRAAAQLVETLARAMAAAHGHGIIHRDLKPANILLSGVWGVVEKSRSGEFITKQQCTDHSLLSAPHSSLTLLTPKITDFGLAKRLDVDSGHTPSGMVTGTPSYMAPEQARGAPAHSPSSNTGDRDGLGPTVDIYALGAILYELLTGRPPFRAATPVETVLQVLGEEPVPPRRLQLSVPHDLETICLKCLAKQPHKRYETAIDLADDLRRYQDGEPIEARRVGRVERLWRWCRRKPAPAGLALASIVAALSLPVAITSALYNARLSDTNARLADALEQTSLAQQSEVAARRREQEAARKADELHYFHRITLASAEWREHRLQRVEQLLDECPLQLRQWEWHYLKRLCHPDVVTLPHRGSLLNVAVSPDGKFIAATGEDGLAALWNAATGKLVHTFAGHTASIYGVRFSSDSERLITASSDKTVRIWEVRTGKEVLSFAGHTDSVRAAVFDPHGKWAASADKTGSVKVWSLHNSSVLLNLPGVRGQDHSLAVSHDGSHLAYGGSGLIKLWDPRSGQEIHSLRGHKSYVRGLAFSPDDARLASAGEDGTCRIWDIDTGALVRTLEGHEGKVYSVAYSGDGRWLATGSMDSTIKIWDASTGQELRLLQGHAGRVYGVTFSPDGRRLVSASTDASVKVWSTATDQEGLALRAHVIADVAAWSPDGKRLATGGAGDGQVKVWEADTGRLLASLPAETTRVYHTVFSPDGRWLAITGHGGRVKIWDALTLAPIHTLQGHEEQTISVAAFGPDSRRLVTGSQDRTARLWDVSSGQQVLCYRGHVHHVQALAFSPDGRRIASSGEDQTIQIWDADTGQTVLSLSEKVRVIRGVAWSPDGQRLAATSSDGVVKIWDLARGESLLKLQGHAHGLHGLSWSPDGKRLASASSDRTVLIWDPDSGEEALALRGHTDEVLDVAWSPDGRRLASAGRDGILRIWDATPLKP